MAIGTLGYVMSEIEIGKPFSEVVLFAKSLGYTEPGLTSYHQLVLNFYDSLNQVLVILI